MLSKKRKRTDNDEYKDLKRKREDNDCESVIIKKQKYYCTYEEYTKYKRTITMYI